MIKSISSISVIGLGTIGHAVAGHFSLHGYSVTAYDISVGAAVRGVDSIRREMEIFGREGLLSDGDSPEKIISRIKITDSLEQAVQGSDYILENISEDLESKRELFCHLESICRPGAIFASNTSSFKLADITRNMTERGRSRTMLCHWFNPGHIIPLVELSFFGNMPEEDYVRVEELYLRVRKRPVRILTDLPGLVANRIQHAVAREVISMLERGVADAEDIDRALKYGPAFRYAAAGQLEVVDFGGLDVWCAVEDNLLPDLDRSVKAAPLLREKVSEGKLGVKSGEGFFSYPKENRDAARADFELRLIRRLKLGLDEA